MRYSPQKIKTVKFFCLIFIATLFFGCEEEKFFKEENFSTSTTLKYERENFIVETINETIIQNLARELNSETEKNYESAFWAMELMLFRNSYTDSVFKSIIKTIYRTSIPFQRAFLEAIYTLYLNDFPKEVLLLAQTTDHPKIFAMSCNYLFQNNYEVKNLIEDYKLKNPQYALHPIITMLQWHLSFTKQQTPSLRDLLSHEFERNKIVVFSLQRKDRNFPGLLLIRKSDGKFLRTENGKLFHVQQLARAISNLPGYLTNGNTPQGIFSIYGVDSSQNIFIGPSPNLQIRLPFEIDAKTFFRNATLDSTWNIEKYKNLLPDSWKNYNMIYEAYLAGEAGRTEIISHGTTIDTKFYETKSYYPLTPSLGCLVTNESWSDSSGVLIESDQLKFMNELMRLPNLEGYFVVVNIDDKTAPVTLGEIEKIISETGR